MKLGKPQYKFDTAGLTCISRLLAPIATCSKKGMTLKTADFENELICLTNLYKLTILFDNQPKLHRTS